MLPFSNTSPVPDRMDRWSQVPSIPGAVKRTRPVAVTPARADVASGGACTSTFSPYTLCNSSVVARLRISNRGRPSPMRTSIFNFPPPSALAAGAGSLNGAGVIAGGGGGAFPASGISGGLVGGVSTGRLVGGVIAGVSTFTRDGIGSSSILGMSGLAGSGFGGSVGSGFAGVGTLISGGAGSGTFGTSPLAGTSFVGSSPLTCMITGAAGGEIGSKTDSLPGFFAGSSALARGGGTAGISRSNSAPCGGFSGGGVSVPFAGEAGLTVSVGSGAGSAGGSVLSAAGGRANTASPPTPTVSVQASTFQRFKLMATLSSFGGIGAVAAGRNNTSPAACLRQLAGSVASH